MTPGDIATSVGKKADKTEVGSVFVSNYPPFSTWTPDAVDEAEAALDRAPRPETPLGVYLHIPFCRKRCKFCYFKVYTDKNAEQIERYLDALLTETRKRVAGAAIAGRAPRFIYFGGGTPSYISSRHLKQLFAGLRELFDWSEVEEVAFECEPGTLTQSKLTTIRELGVTRLSLGIENWNDRILEDNGRAHVTKEIDRVLPWISELDFPQLNVDLIAGMIGESDATWKDSVARTIEARPDSVTIYQLELPYNTVYSRKVLDGESLPVADWETKRRWHGEAIDALSAAGYEISSGYTMVRADKPSPFVYRNNVWQGCDLLALGVSSFGHVGGVHYQNETNWERYMTAAAAGEPAINRALTPSDDERLTREFILQLKLGRLDTRPLAEKFGVDPLERFAAPLAELSERGMLEIDDRTIVLSRDGLLQVDSLLPNFYAPEYQNARYT